MISFQHLPSWSSSTPSCWSRRPSSPWCTMGSAQHPSGIHPAKSLLACSPSPTSFESCKCTTNRLTSRWKSSKSTNWRRGEVNWTTPRTWSGSVPTPASMMPFTLWFTTRFTDCQSLILNSATSSTSSHINGCYAFSSSMWDNSAKTKITSTLFLSNLDSWLAKAELLPQVHLRSWHWHLWRHRSGHLWHTHHRSPEQIRPEKMFSSANCRQWRQIAGYLR